jgi:hypothetical protein
LKGETTGRLLLSMVGMVLTFNLVRTFTDESLHPLVCLGLPDGEIMEGSIPNNKMKLVEAWIEIHKEDLLANWELAVNGQEVFKIEPLK